MNKFNDTYKKIVMLYEDVLISKTKFRTFDYEVFLKGLHILKTLNVISEDKCIFDIPNEIINKCLNIDAFSIKISNKEFKELFQKSIHWRNLKNVNFPQLILFNFNFLDETSINMFHTSLFNKKLSNNELKLFKNMFLENVQNCYGFANKLNNNIYVIAVNELSLKEKRQVIIHELSHFIQDICEIKLIKKSLNKEIHTETEILKYFNLTDEKIEEGFSSKEFLTNVQDLCMGLKIVFNDFEIKQDDFLKILKEQIKDPLCLKEQWIFKEYEKHNKNVFPLVMLCLSKTLSFRYQHILNHIERYFNEH